MKLDDLIEKLEIARIDIINRAGHSWNYDIFINNKAIHGITVDTDHAFKDVDISVVFVQDHVEDKPYLQTSHVGAGNSGSSLTQSPLDFFNFKDFSHARIDDE